jgi:hypothetical protein
LFPPLSIKRRSLAKGIKSSVTGKGTSDNAYEIIDFKVPSVPTALDDVYTFNVTSLSLVWMNRSN